MMTVIFGLTTILFLYCISDFYQSMDFTIVFYFLLIFLTKFSVNLFLSTMLGLTLFNIIWYRSYMLFNFYMLFRMIGKLHDYK